MIGVLAVTAALVAPSGVEAAIRVEYRKWDAAYLNLDVAVLASILHSRFVLVTGSGGRVTRKDYVRRLWKSTLPASYRTVVRKVDGTQKQATVSTLEEMKLPGQVVRSHEYLDTWVYAAEGWQMTESRTVGGH